MAAYDTIIAGHRYVIHDAEGFAFRVTKGADGMYSAVPSHMQAATDTRRFVSMKRLKDLAGRVAKSTRD